MINKRDANEIRNYVHRMRVIRCIMPICPHVAALPHAISEYERASCHAVVVRGCQVARKLRIAILLLFAIPTTIVWRMSKPRMWVCRYAPGGMLTRKEEKKTTRTVVHVETEENNRSRVSSRDTLLTLRRVK